LRPFLPAPGVLPLVDFFAIIGTQLLLIRWQVRFQELEADSHAVIALGASPGALIGGIARTMRLNDLQTSENDPNALINAGAAHPTVAARAAELNRRIHAAKDGRPLDLRWEPYRALRGTGGTAVIACAALLLSALAWGWTAKILPARALRIAAQTGDLDRLSALRPTANLDASDPLTLYTPLTAALSTGCFSGARWLVEHGADAGRADARGITPIIMASVRGDADAVRLLVAHGADPRTPNMKGFNPAAIAAMRGDVALFEALKDAGVDLNAPAWKGRPPLALTDHMKKTAASSWLRAHGAREPEPERP
jgi:hypothetical protein